MVGKVTDGDLLKTHFLPTWWKFCLRFYFTIKELKNNQKWQKKFQFEKIQKLF